MLKNKKIAYLITQSKYGGAQRYVLDLASHFQKNNQVVLAVGEKNNQDPDFFNQVQKRDLRVEIIPSLRRAVDPAANAVGLMEIYKFLKRQKPDLLHINSSMAGFIGAIAAFLYNLNPYASHIRVIYTAHGFVFNEPMSKAKKKFYIFLERMSASWKHAIIAVSHFDKQTATAAGIKANKIFVIHLGLPTMTQKLSMTEARQALGLQPEGIIVGSIASHYPTKDLVTMIKAFTFLPPSLRLAIIGDGTETTHLQELITTEHLEQRVFLLGAKKNASQYLPAFNLFALSSIKEGLPYALLEAGQTSLACVATRVGGIPEIIEDKKTGLLVEVGDPKALAQAIQSLVEQPAQASTYARALNGKVFNEFSIQSMLQQTEALYERLF